MTSHSSTCYGNVRDTTVRSETRDLLGQTRPGAPVDGNPMTSNLRRHRRTRVPAIVPAGGPDGFVSAIVGMSGYMGNVRPPSWGRLLS